MNTTTDVLLENILSCRSQTHDQLSRTYVTFNNSLEAYAGLPETSKM